MNITERQLYVLLETTKETLTIRGGDFTFTKEDRESAVMGVIDSMNSSSVPIGRPQQVHPQKTQSISPGTPDNDPLEIPEELKNPVNNVGKLARPKPKTGIEG